MSGARTRRPRFVPSQLVSAADLNAGHDDAIARMRRHNQSLHGCGVVCGLEAEMRLDDDGIERLVISPGTALDGVGNELCVTDEVSVRLADLCWLADAEGGRTVGTWPPDAHDPCGPTPGDQIYFLAICYLERQECATPIAHSVCATDEVCEHLRLSDGHQLMLLDSIHDTDCVSRAEPVEDSFWRGHYYEWDGEGLAPLLPTELPVLVRDDPVLDVRWAGSPGGEVSGEAFQVEWTRRMYFNAGRYRFDSRSDGAVIVEVDGQQVVNTWTLTAHASGTVILAPGVHDVRVVYGHRRGAAELDVRWQTLESGWSADYRSFTGGGPPVFEDSTPVLSRIDPGIAIDLPPGAAPHADLPVDRFVVRWERDVSISAAGRYEFEVETDDGMRLWVDGSLIVNEWQAQTRRRFRTHHMLSGGTHRIRVEFWERTGAITAKVRWRHVGPYNPAVCPSALHPGCVVLAAVEVVAGGIRSIENYVFDSERGHERHVVPTTAAVGAGLSQTANRRDRPLLAQIVPGHAAAGTTENVLLVGHALDGVTEVRFDGGVTAEVLPGASEHWVPLQITVPAGVGPGPREFAVVTPFCTYDSGTYGLTFDVDAAIASPSIPPSRMFTSGFDVPTVPPTVVVPSGGFGPIGPGGGGIIFGDVALDDLELESSTLDALNASGFETGGEVLAATPAEVAGRTGLTEVAGMGLIESVREALVAGRHALEDAASMPITTADGIGAARAEHLTAAGLTTLGDLAAAAPSELAATLSMPVDRVETLVADARRRIEAMREQRSADVGEVPGIGAVRSERLRDSGLTTIAHVAVVPAGRLAAAGGLSEAEARTMIAAARKMAGATP